MACNRWEETGLLYSSGELSDEESVDYREHLQACNECAVEYETYQKEKRTFFTSDILCALPSKKCDEEILRICSDGRKKVFTFQPISLFFKRTLVSLTLFIVGFTSISYLTVKMNNSGVQNSQEVANSIAIPTTDSLNKTLSDSAKDTTPVNRMNYAKTRGNLAHEGVVPVDLPNK